MNELPPPPRCKLKLTLTGCMAIPLVTLAGGGAGYIVAPRGDDSVVEENYAKIQNGMTLEQVTEIMGKPSSINESTKEGIKHENAAWYTMTPMSGVTKRILVNFIKGKVVGKSWVEGPTGS